MCNHRKPECCWSCNNASIPLYKVLQSIISSPPSSHNTALSTSFNPSHRSEVQLNSRTHPIRDAAFIGWQYGGVNSFCINYIPRKPEQIYRGSGRGQTCGLYRRPIRTVQLEELRRPRRCDRLTTRKTDLHLSPPSDLKWPPPCQVNISMFQNVASAFSSAMVVPTHVQPVGVFQLVVAETFRGVITQSISYPPTSARSTIHSWWPCSSLILIFSHQNFRLWNQPSFAANFLWCRFFGHYHRIVLNVNDGQIFCLLGIVNFAFRLLPQRFLRTLKHRHLLHKIIWLREEMK